MKTSKIVCMMMLVTSILMLSYSNAYSQPSDTGDSSTILMCSPLYGKPNTPNHDLVVYLNRSGKPTRFKYVDFLSLDVKATVDIETIKVDGETIYYGFMDETHFIFAVIEIGEELVTIVTYSTESGEVIRSDFYGIVERI